MSWFGIGTVEAITQSLKKTVIKMTSWETTLVVSTIEIQVKSASFEDRGLRQYPPSHCAYAYKRRHRHRGGARRPRPRPEPRPPPALPFDSHPDVQCFSTRRLSWTRRNRLPSLHHIHVSTAAFPAVQPLLFRPPPSPTAQNLLIALQLSPLTQGAAAGTSLFSSMHRLSRMTRGRITGSTATRFAHALVLSAVLS